MGLDIYAGPLCRYYAGDWMTVIQRWGAEQGVPVTVVRPNSGMAGIFGRFFSRLTANLINQRPEDGVRAWGERIAQAGHFPSSSDWNWTESLSAPYETDKPSWDGYGAVQLLAAYAEKKKPVPADVQPADWSNDSVFADVEKMPTVFTHIIGPELWLPVAFEKVFSAPEPNGSQTKMGSVFTLWDQFQMLNTATWSADPEAIRGWRMADFDPDNFDEVARWGYSIWYCLVEFAVKNRVAMRLDY